MGAYFSLRGEGEWDQTVSETMEPSIWTNVAFTPLSRTQKMLLHRGGEVQFAFPGGIRQGGDVIQVSEVVDLSLLVGFEESAGRLYSALVVHAPLDTARHTYSRAVEEVLLTAPGARPAKTTESTDKGSEMFSGSMTLDQLDKEEAPAQVTEWEYLMLYTVKEGVLAFFGHDLESCEEVVRDIAAHYGEHLPPANGASPGSGTAAGVSLAAAVKVKTAMYPIGRAPPPVGRVFTELISSDLKREFAIRCEAEEQSSCTNCVVFCLRMMLGMKMSVRGYDIRQLCESRPDLGPLVGTAAGDAWEQLW
eukprot:CAMPEP_0115376754 /NCGR_PEP_ID=MMETSP0271-20121206/3137_1 /TAXON_ID=71861 /ORGANISM="Scrippsiella trochoidea, Strain CCMP3099" /LENGTH=305 /DNA_ID=CAMNT_0002799851 /DNA_START=51 /DNA_END=965 /DNA_ORIENTATION=-